MTHFWLKHHRACIIPSVMLLNIYTVSIPLLPKRQWVLFVDQKEIAYTGVSWQCLPLAVLGNVFAYRVLIAIQTVLKGPELTCILERSSGRRLGAIATIGIISIPPVRTSSQLKGRWIPDSYDTRVSLDVGGWGEPCYSGMCVRACVCMYVCMYVCPCVRACACFQKVKM